MGPLTLRLKVAQKPYIWSLGPKAVKQMSPQSLRVRVPEGCTVPSRQGSGGLGGLGFRGLGFRVEGRQPSLGDLSKLSRGITKPNFVFGKRRVA